METVQITTDLLRQFLLDRENDSHKHQYGHALLVCGCESMPGAAVMATGSALHSGCGLVTLRSTRTACQAAMVRYPSAMLSIEKEEVIATGIPTLSRYSSVGIGPGLGQDPRTREVLAQVLRNLPSKGTELVLDADALNIIAADDSMKLLIPAGTVLTPHEGELRRLFSYGSEEEKHKVVSEFCKRMGCVLISKGYHTRVFSPDGMVYENTTGNPGMAKGGSGDVLTGLVAGLLARGYTPLQAALLGVWIHGYAGDCLTRERTAECYAAQDLIDYLYLGFKELYEK